jgi:uncharacterized alkaline shock family protein YloU
LPKRGQSIGEIRINDFVIADIVVLNTTKRDGVLMVRKQGFANGIESFFQSKTKWWWIYYFRR